MKTFLTIIAAFFMMSAVAMEPANKPDKPSPEGIDFHESSWDDALKIAKESGKYIFLDISASWCGPCKALKRNTFSNEEVGEYYNTHFVNVLLDGEKGEGITLAKKYEISGYPTMIFFNSNGEIIAKTSGYRAPQEFIDLGKQIVER